MLSASTRWKDDLNCRGVKFVGITATAPTVCLRMISADGPNFTKEHFGYVSIGGEIRFVTYFLGLCNCPRIQQKLNVCLNPRLLRHAVSSTQGLYLENLKWLGWYKRSNDLIKSYHLISTTNIKRHIGQRHQKTKSTKNSTHLHSSWREPFWLFAFCFPFWPALPTLLPLTRNMRTWPSQFRLENVKRWKIRLDLATIARAGNISTNISRTGNAGSTTGAISRSFDTFGLAVRSTVFAGGWTDPSTGWTLFFFPLHGTVTRSFYLSWNGIRCAPVQRRGVAVVDWSPAVRASKVLGFRQVFLTQNYISIHGLQDMQIP